MTCHLLQELLKNEDGARLRTYLRGTQLRPLFAMSSRRATRWRRSWRKFYWDESFLTETKTAWGAGWLLILSGMRETCLQHLQAFYVARGQTLNVIKEKTNQRRPERKSPRLTKTPFAFFFTRFYLSASNWLKSRCTSGRHWIKNLQYKKKDRRPGKLHFGPARIEGAGTYRRQCVTSHSRILISAARTEKRPSHSSTHIRWTHALEFPAADYAEAEKTKSKHTKFLLG